jgi:hypothetical protein
VSILGDFLKEVCSSLLFQELIIQATPEFLQMESSMEALVIQLSGN